MPRFPRLPHYRVAFSDDEPKRDRLCTSAAARRAFSGLQSLVQKRQARVHPVVDVGVVVVEFLVAMPDAGGGEASGEDARAVVDVVLVAPAAVDVDAAKRPEVVPISGDELDRVVLAPLPPALLDRLP